MPHWKRRINGESSGTLSWRLVVSGYSALLENFNTYLAQHGVSLTALSTKESFSITKRWTTEFATQSESLNETRGMKAVSQWLSSKDEQLILLFLSEKITAFPISTNSRPCSAHRYNGPAVDLSAYNELEFAVFPETYQWTLVHTHEDHAFGGPYFICQSDIGK